MFRVIQADANTTGGKLAIAAAHAAGIPTDPIDYNTADGVLVLDMGLESCVHYGIPDGIKVARAGNPESAVPFSQGFALSWAERCDVETCVVVVNSSLISKFGEDMVGHHLESLFKQIVENRGAIMFPKLEHVARGTHAEDRVNWYLHAKPDRAPLHNDLVYSVTAGGGDDHNIYRFSKFGEAMAALRMRITSLIIVCNLTDSERAAFDSETTETP